MFCKKQIQQHNCLPIYIQLDNYNLIIWSQNSSIMKDENISATNKVKAHEGPWIFLNLWEQMIMPRYR